MIGCDTAIDKRKRKIIIYNHRVSDVYTNKRYNNNDNK